MLGTPWYWPQTSRPPPHKKKRLCWAKAPLLCGTPKDEEHRASLRGSQLYLLSATREREREKGRMGGVKKKKRKKKTQERKREGDSGGVAMVTEIWLLFKNLECRWWWDECMCVCVFFFLLVFPFQFCRYYGCAGSLLISQRTEMPSALFFLNFFYGLRAVFLGM